MDMTGEYRIPASRDKVWAALNDPAVLQAAMPGCEKLEPVGDDQYAATVMAKVGPVKARFAGNVAVMDARPPESYRIEGEGKGGAAGFAKGGAEVRLAEDGDGTVLTYHAKAEVGGKMAQLGSRLIEGTAKKLATEFFDNLAQAVAGPPPQPVPEPPPPAPAPAPEPLWQNRFIWAAAVVVVLMLLALLLR